MAVLPACTSARPEAPPAAGEGRVSGRVLRILPESRQVELTDAGRRFSIFYTDETLIKSGPVELRITDVKEGDRIVVSLGGDEKAQARLIALAGPTRSPAPPEAKQEDPLP